MIEEKGPRNAILIAAQLSMLLPPEQQEFRNDLTEFIKSSAYTSPELCIAPAIWIKLECVMKKYIIDTNEEWKQRLIDLYIGKTEFQNL